MTDYAKDFLRKHNAKMTISNTKEISDMTGGWLYRVRIDRNGKSWTFRFGDSVYNKEHNERPTKYDVLACIEKYEPYGDVCDFASEFGYKINDRESYKATERIFKAVKKEYNNVMRMFGDCIEELREIW